MKIRLLFISSDAYSHFNPIFTQCFSAAEVLMVPFRLGCKSRNTEENTH